MNSHVFSSNVEQLAGRVRDEKQPLKIRGKAAYGLGTALLQGAPAENVEPCLSAAFKSYALAMKFCKSKATMYKLIVAELAQTYGRTNQYQRNYIVEQANTLFSKYSKTISESLTKKYLQSEERLNPEDVSSAKLGAGSR